MAQDILVAMALAAVSLLYAMAGQAGGTGFLAVMGLASVAPEQMRPTALWLNILASGYATARLWRVLDYPTLARVILPALPGALVGGMLALPAGLYTLTTGGLLLAAAVLLMARPAGQGSERMAAGPAALAGAVAGLLAGLTGVGGGVFLVPVLVGFGWLSARRAALISPPFILANSVIGLAGVTWSGQRASAALPVFALAAVCGAIAGTAIGLRWMNERTTRIVLALVLAAAGVRLVLR